jgi:serine/threonine protein kinase/Tfp pilus assembly protein PilF
MGGELTCDEELVLRLPFPLAKLYRRAHNAKTALDRHQGAYYLWEAALKLLGSVAVVTYAERGEYDPELAERLKGLARPSMGHWWEFVRRVVPVLADASDAGFEEARDLVLGRTRTDLPRVAALDRELREALGGQTGPKGRVRLSELFDRLVRYRNGEIGHGAAGLGPTEFYDRMGRSLLAGATELLGRLDVLAGRRLVYIDDVRRQASGSWLIERYELTGESARRIVSLDWVEGEVTRLPLPKRLYLNASPGPHDSATNPTIATAPAISDHQPLPCLHPLVVYDAEMGEVLFLNARRDAQRTEYLSYTTGRRVQRKDLGGEQRALLAQILGKPVDDAQLYRWAARSAAEEQQAAPPVQESAGPSLRHLGEFELLSELGRGSMGVVYRAWQPSLGRQVALKRVLRAGDAKAEARFNREIHALGRVEHPNLVKIFTSGFEGDQWYYAMELVEGSTLAAICDTLHGRISSAAAVSLDTWRESLRSACEEARKAEKPLSDGESDTVQAGQSTGDELSTIPPPVDRSYAGQAVELMRQVALAAYALHAHGVVHRDIKPGNIIVTPDGSQAVLMDLGLAQLADDVEGRLTHTRQFVGTLRYASPEQVLAVGGVDRRSDVYSLGATLWELLTLRPMHGAAEQTPTPELMRQITSEDVERVRVHHPGIAADLEAIVHKCLEKDPKRRYETAAELAEDLARWQRGELVTAQPLTTRYVLGKFVRRHRWQIAAVAALVLLVTAGLTFELYRSNRDNTRLLSVNNELKMTNGRLRTALRQVDEQRLAAVRARGEAEKARSYSEVARTKAERAEVAAKGSAAKAEAINGFLTMIFTLAKPELNARNITVGELLDQASLLASLKFRDQPEVEAALRASLGSTYQSLGELVNAEPQFRRWLELCLRFKGSEHPDTLTAMNNLAVLLSERGKSDEPERLFRQIVEAHHRLMGDEDPRTLVARSNLAIILEEQGQLEEAEPTYRELLESSRRILGDKHPSTLASIHILASSCQERGKLDEAESLYRQALESSRDVLGVELQKLKTMSRLASVLSARGKWKEAESLYGRVLEVCHRVLGDEHPETLVAMDGLASLYRNLGKLEEAERLSREALEAERLVLSAEHPTTLNTMDNLAWVLDQLGKPEEAESLFRRNVEVRRRVQGAEHPHTLITTSNLAYVLQERGKLEEAEQLCQQVLEAERRILGDEHPETLRTMDNLALVLRSRDKLEEAESLHRRVLESRRRVLGPEHPDVLATMFNIAWVLWDRNKLEEAETLYRQTLEARRRILGAEHYQTLSAAGFLAALLSIRNKVEEAEPLTRQILEVQRRVQGPEHPNTLILANNLAALLSRGKPEEAEKLYRQVVEGHRHTRGAEHPDTLIAIGRLASFLMDRDKPEEAEKLYRQVVEAHRRARGAEHPKTLASIGILASFLKSRGKLEEVEALYRQVLEVRRRIQGDEHPDTLTTMNNLAVELQAQGKMEEAEALYRQVVEVRRRIPGVEHPDTLTAMNNLASFLQDLGKLEEAEALYREVAEVRRRVLGDEHLETLATINGLAQVLEAQGKLEEAETLYHQVVEARRRLQGAEHLETLSAMYNLAVLYQAQGRLEEAEDLSRQVVDARRRVQGAEHPETLNSINNLAIFLLDRNKPTEAELLLRELLQARRKLEPPDLFGIANTLSPLGWALTGIGRAREAEPLLREALEIRRKILPEGHWATASTEGLLGSCLRTQGRYDEAESLLLASYARISAAAEVPPIRICQTLERIVALYEAWGKSEKAAEWRRRLMDFPVAP